MSKKLLALVSALLLFLSFRFYFYYSTHNVLNYIDGQQVNFTGVLVKEPKVIERFQTFFLVDDQNEKIFIKTSKFPQFYYGQTVRVVGRLTMQVLKNNQTVLIMLFPQIEAIKFDKNLSFLPQNYLLAVISSIRQKVSESFAKTLPAISSSLLLGIVFGFKEEFPKQFYDSLRLSGVMHVIAASGMNVTMVGGFLSSFFALLFRRQLAILLTILGIVFYAVLAGLEPSIIRASIMGILVFSAQILGRQTLAVYSLLITGFLMLFLSPDLLLDVGFQLSFLSTLGLLYIKPLFGRSESSTSLKIRKQFFIADDLTTTISAQVATLPILFGNFGTYSLWSIIVNGLVLWTIPVLMIFGGLGAIFSLIWQPLSLPFLYLSLPFLLFFEKTVVFFANLPGLINLNTQIVDLPWQITAGYYFILISLIIYLSRKLK